MKYPCVVPYDDETMESIQDKRDFNTRGLQKLNAQLLMLRDFMYHKLDNLLNLECAVLFLSDIKDILISYCLWYLGCKTADHHGKSMKYHFKFEGSPRIRAVRRAQILDLSGDIGFACDCIRNYVKTANDVRALDLLMKQLLRVNMECDRYLDEFWSQFPPKEPKNKKGKKY